MKFLEGTVAKIEAPAGKRDILVFDDSLPGFGIRAFSSGRRSFFVKFSVGHQQRKITLGPVVPGTLAEMRRKAADVLAKARLGEDVQAAKKAHRERKVATVGALVRRYLAVRAGEMRPRSWQEIERHLLRHWAPLHDRGIETITRRDLVARIEEIAESSGRTAADRCKASMSAFLAWCIEHSYLDANVSIGIRRRVINGARERVLGLPELVQVWNACRPDDYGQICKLLILTGQRKTEIGNLAWSEIDVDRRQIELPGSRTKNSRPHTVPLSDAAIDILRTVIPRAGRDLIFGAGAGGFSGWSKAKVALDARLPTDMPPWRIHDIRRSVVTHMNELGIAAPHVIEAIANHVSGGSKGGVAGVYNRAVYADEKRQALEKWAAVLATALP